MQAQIGCTPEPSPECVAYLECIEYVDTTLETGGTSGLDAYAEEGSCWLTPTTRETCTKACVASGSELADLLTKENLDAGPCAF